jgi:diketogulonate reductase-like aldo/keto reductase
MPVIGLGTGGLSYSETQHVIKSSLDIGYRLLDLAREYNNEHIVPLVFKEYEKDSQLPYTVTRSDVFIITKVWPTELGFYPTSTAIMKSLVSLETNYVDLYLLHWPA